MGKEVYVELPSSNLKQAFFLKPFSPALLFSSENEVHTMQ